MRQRPSSQVPVPPACPCPPLRASARRQPARPADRRPDRQEGEPTPRRRRRSTTTDPARPRARPVSISMSVTHKGCTGWIGDGRNGVSRSRPSGETVWIQPNDKFWEYALCPGFPAVGGPWPAPDHRDRQQLAVCRVRAVLQREQAGVHARPAVTGLVKGKTIKISGASGVRVAEKQRLGELYVSTLEQAGNPAHQRQRHDQLLRIRGARVKPPRRRPVT